VLLNVSHTLNEIYAIASAQNVNDLKTLIIVQECWQAKQIRHASRSFSPLLYRMMEILGLLLRL